MALRRREFQFVQNASTLTASPEEGEAWRVYKIEVKGGNEEDTIEIKIGKTSVFYAPLVWGGKSLFGFSTADPSTKNFFDLLSELGIPLVFPVAAGESITIECSATVDAIKIHYNVYDAGDVRSTEPNGSKADTYTLISWVANSSAVTDSGWVTLDTSKCPAEYPDFPALAVPSNTQADIHLLAFRAFAASVGDGSSSTGTSYSKYLRLIYRRAVLFDPNRNGWITLGNSAYSETGTTMTYDYDATLNELPVVPTGAGKVQHFDPPLSIPSGEELTVQAYVEHASGVDVPAGKVQAIMLITFKPQR